MYLNSIYKLTEIYITIQLIIFYLQRSISYYLFFSTQNSELVSHYLAGCVSRYGLYEGHAARQVFVFGEFFGHNIRDVLGGELLAGPQHHERLGDFSGQRVRHAHHRHVSYLWQFANYSFDLSRRHLEQVFILFRLRHIFR